MSTCHGCGVPVTQPEGRGRPRKWCSEKCRKDTCYAGVCIDCGGPTNGLKSGRNRESVRCDHCFKTKNLARRERILAAWNQWEPAWMIAEREGISETNVLTIVNQQRRAGRHVILHRKRNRTDWPEVERLYHESLSYGEIADELGMSYHNVSQMVQKMRDAGYDLPMRHHRWWKRQQETAA